ncbi:MULTISPECIES: nitrate/nitrite transporter [Nocardiaceae]|uniref:Nitrate/nitrite transporter NarK n=1 Tax=Rhodococcoides corynebacterioides TaxID=53972 RepID=A0ABS2KZL5_9NOCA|nr:MULTISPECIES: MFS transporter [Rhodococcus]MBM7417369.1 nitrate/nitrite transporter NarK [Rhodococcus corynebacterioides]MBP1115623.1 nitrate/nitrite transporter NarK [Rhodococcus sp. PvP016]
MSSSRVTNLLVAYLALVCAFLPYVGWSPSLGAISEELSLSYSQAGGISSITGLVAGAMILIGGVVASRWGCKSVIVVGLASGVLGQAVFAMAQGFELVVVARVLAGVSVGFLWVSTYTMAVNWFRDSRKTGRALGVMLSGDGVGAVLSLFVFSAVLAAFGWRTGLTVQAVVMGVVLVLVLVVSRNAPVAGPENSQSSVSPTAAPFSSDATYRSLLNRNVVAAVLIWVGGVGLFAAISSWMPSILVEDAGMSESLAGLLTALFSIAGSAAALTVPLLAERIGGTKKIIMVAGFVTAAALAALTLFLSTGHYLLVVLLVPVIGIGVYASESLTLAEAIESVQPKFAGVVNGIIIGTPWLVSGFAYPYLLGAVKDATGSFVQGFSVLTVLTVGLCAVTPLFMRETAAHVDQPSPSPVPVRP